MAAYSQFNDAQMPTDAFRDLVGWFPRSGKAAEGLWVQHQGVLAIADKLAQSQQKIDVIFLQAGDPFLARIRDLNVEVLQPSWISKSLREGQLSSVAAFRLTDAPRPFPTRSLPPSPRSQSTHADEAEPAITIKNLSQNMGQDVENNITDVGLQQLKTIETFSPISQSGFSTGLFACPTASAAIKVESPPFSLPFANTNACAEPTTQINLQDQEIKLLPVPSAASIVSQSMSIEEKMEGLRKSIDDLSAKQGIKIPVKRERHSPVLPIKSSPKASSSLSNSTRGDWRAHAAVARSLNDDSKSYIRSFSTRRGRSMSFKQEEDEAVLAISGTPLSMRRKGPYSRNPTKTTSVYHKNKPQRVLLSPIKIQNTVARQMNDEPAQ